MDSRPTKAITKAKYDKRFEGLKGKIGFTESRRKSDCNNTLEVAQRC